jgi:hypothetical protein
VKAGEQTPAKASANLPGINPATPFSSVTHRSAGKAPQDETRDNLEVLRLEPPADFQKRWEGYKNKISKVAAPTATRSQSTSKPK